MLSFVVSLTMAYPFYGFMPFFKGLAPIGYAASFIQAIHNIRLYLPAMRRNEFARRVPDSGW
jgi:hypothetical protein